MEKVGWGIGKWSEAGGADWVSCERAPSEGASKRDGDKKIPKAQLACPPGFLEGELSVFLDSFWGRFSPLANSNERVVIFSAAYLCMSVLFFPL